MADRLQTVAGRGGDLVVPSLSAAHRLQSWHVIVAGLFVQTALGAWMLWAGLRPDASPIGKIAGTIIGSALLFLVGIATIFLLPALWMLYVGRYRGIAIGIVIVVGVGFLAPLNGAAVWPLPAFLAMAVLLAWRERATEAG